MESFWVVNGLILLALNDFLESQQGEDAWSQAMSDAGLEEQDFDPEHFYPDQVSYDLFDAVAAKLNLPLPETLEQFGRHLAPGLVEMGRHMGVINKSWKTIDILENLHDPILTAFSNVQEGILPPEIRTYRIKHSEVAVAYVSKRKLCHLFKGIVFGMGEFFQEPIMLREPVCMLHGNDAPLCRLAVFLDDPQLARYVNIKREFEIVHSRIQELTFYNQFGGIPFSHPGLVLQFGDKEVMVQAPKEQLVAMEDDNKTFIAVTHIPFGLKALVKDINLEQGFATLHRFVLTDGAVGQRCYKRVAPDTQFDIKITVEDGKSFKGKVHNISGGGLKAAISKKAKLDESFLFVQVSMEFSLPLKWVKKGDTIELGPHDFTLDGNILDIRQERGQRTLRIVFSTLNSRDLFVMDQYYQRKLEEVQPVIKKRLESIQ